MILRQLVAVHMLCQVVIDGPRSTGSLRLPENLSKRLKRLQEVFSLLMDGYGMELESILKGIRDEG